MPPDAEEFLIRMRANKYLLHSSKNPGINIVGWRKVGGVVDTFSDYISVYAQGTFSWKHRFWKAATRPGKHYLQVPLLSKGTAILATGQYVKAYELGYFRGQKALRQVGLVNVYRDKDRDSQYDLDPTTIETGLFGLHIHRAGFWSKVVGSWSAGCQVFQRAQDFEKFLAICEDAAVSFGPRFTYTLMEF